MKYSIIIVFTSLLTLSCSNNEVPTDSEASVKASLVSIASNNLDQFNDYWYAGEAELSSYEFELIRYGEKRKGNAVLIFVTEPFSESKQVKLDKPNSSSEDNISILKLNKIARFTTGIYDYSLMQSLFTPISYKKYPHTLKTTSTSQDWCGQTFAQLNYADDKGYVLNNYSYFEQEGDQKRKIGEALLEDELFMRLRIDPQSIPAGNSDLIPGLFYSSMTHSPLKIKKARISFKSQNESTSQCTVEYLHLDRTVNITYQSSFPHNILHWEEINNGKTSVQAKIKKTLKSPYWQKNARQDTYLRDSLGLL